MKYILLVLFAINFAALAGSCNESSLNSLHRMSDDEYCSEEDVIEATYAAYGSREGDKIKVYTPKKEEIYGDNDGSSFLVLDREEEKSKYVRFTIEYGRCRIHSCTDSGVYRDEI